MKTESEKFNIKNSVTMKLPHALKKVIFLCYIHAGSSCYRAVPYSPKL